VSSVRGKQALKGKKRVLGGIAFAAGRPQFILGRETRPRRTEGGEPGAGSLHLTIKTSPSIQLEKERVNGMKRTDSLTALTAEKRIKVSRSPIGESQEGREGSEGGETRPHPKKRKKKGKGRR